MTDNKQIDIIVGRNVRNIRTTAGKTQTDLANHLGFTFQQVQKNERGANRIGAARMMAIAEYLGCSIMDLYEGTGADELAEEGKDLYQHTRQGASHCEHMGELEPHTRRSIETLVKSLS